MTVAPTTLGSRLKIYFSPMALDDPTDSIPTGKIFYLYGAAPSNAISIKKKPEIKESTATAPDGGKGPSSIGSYTYDGTMTLEHRPDVLPGDLHFQSVLRMGDQETNAIGAVYTAATGILDFAASTGKPTANGNETVRFASDDVAWVDIPFIMVPTATEHQYQVYPAPIADKTFALSGGITPMLVQGGVQYLNASMVGDRIPLASMYDPETGDGGTSIEGAVITVTGATIDFTGVADATRPWGVRNGLPYLVNGASKVATPNNNGIYYLEETATEGIYTMSPPPEADETLPATAKLHGDAFIDQQRQKEFYVLVIDETLNLREYYTGIQVTSLDNQQPEGDEETCALSVSGKDYLYKEDGDTYSEVLSTPAKTYTTFVTSKDPRDTTRRSDDLLLVGGEDKAASCSLITSGFKVERTTEALRAQKREAVCGYSDTDFKVTVTAEARRSDLYWAKNRDDRGYIKALCTSVNYVGDDVFYGVYAPNCLVNVADMDYQSGSPTIKVEMEGNSLASSAYTGRIAYIRYRDVTP